MLLVDCPVDPEAHLDPARVGQYAKSLDELPPVVVFDTERGLLLVDGYHRLAAARRLGRTTLNVELHHGSRSDALQYLTTKVSRERGTSVGDVLGHVLERARQAGHSSPAGGA
jgi:hypothetical protein